MPTINLTGGTSMRITDERMEQLADYISRLIEQGKTEQGKHHDRWRQSRSDYDNVAIPYISKIIQNAEDVPEPFAQPRADALSDFVISSIASQSPLVTCTDAPAKPEPPQMPQMGMMGGSSPQMGGPVGVGPLQPPPPVSNRQEHRERTMDFLIRRGKFTEVLKTISVNAWATNHGIVRLAYGGAENPLKFDAIDPEDFICVGSAAYDIEESRCVGHRYERARGELKLLQIEGLYADSIEMDDLQTESQSTDNTNDAAATGDTGAPASSDEDLITLWQVYVIIDPKSWSESDNGPEVSGKERRFNVVIEPNTHTILRIEEYPYRHLCYFSFGYKAPPDKGFWHPRSVGADMQGPHRAYNCLANVAKYGVLMTAFPPLVAQHGAFSKNQTYGAASFVEMESGDLSAPTITFDLGKCQAELARIASVGDSVARINQAGIAQESQQSKTATQSNNEAAGMRAGIGGYLETFTNPIPLMCEHAEEILADTFNEWKPIFGENTPVQSADDMQSRIRWDVPGKIPNLNPQMVVQNATALMGMFKQIVDMVTVAPQAIGFGLKLLQMTMNAMDIQGADEMIKELTPQPQGINGTTGPNQTGTPGMVGGVGGQPNMGDPLQGVMGGAQNGALPQVGQPQPVFGG